MQSKPSTAPSPSFPASHGRDDGSSGSARLQHPSNDHYAESVILLGNSQGFQPWLNSLTVPGNTKQILLCMTLAG